jgi:P4 family phage/plasmid primase-like protien
MLLIGPEHAPNLAVNFAHKRAKRLRYYREDFHEYKAQRYRVVPQESVELELLGFLNEVYEAEVEWRRKRAKEQDKEFTYPRPVTENLLRLVFKNVKRCTLVDAAYEMPMWMGERHNYIAFKNGLVDMDALLAGARGGIIPHDEKWFSANVLPFDFDPDAKYPRWQQFLDEVMPDKENQQLLQEWFGLCMTADSSYQAFMLLEGASRAGKGTIVRVLQGLLGEDNYSAIPLDQFNDRFAIANLYGKLLNVCSEANKITPNIVERVKLITGEDSIEADRKHKNTLKFTPRSKILITSNARPSFPDNSDALINRMLVIHFSTTVPEGKRIKGFSELLLEAEGSGIFNWAIEGYVRLRKVGKFTKPKVMVEQIEAIQKEDNPEVAVLKNVFAPGDPKADYVTKDMAYEHYSFACSAGQVETCAPGTKFVKLLRTHFPSFHIKTVGSGEHRGQEAYWGIKLQ